MSLPGVKNPPADYEKQHSQQVFKQTGIELEARLDSNADFGALDTERDIATHIISVHDDQTSNPWTLRAFIMGLGLSAFGSVLGKSFAYLRLLRLIIQR